MENLTFRPIKFQIDLGNHIIHDLIDVRIRAVNLNDAGVVDDDFQDVLGEVKGNRVGAWYNVSNRGNKILKVELILSQGLFQAGPGPVESDFRIVQR